MSINFTSDIDGATRGSGITQITVGGKTINLTEVSSGGSTGGVASGSFTPEAQAASYSIDTGVNFNCVVVGKKTNTVGYGYRTMCGFFADIQNDFAHMVHTNSSGTAFAGGTQTPATFGIAKDGTTLNLNLNVSSYGYFCPEEYVWYAW